MVSAMLESVWLNCPYCGEAFETAVDCSAGNQRYVEDCAVCCRPIDVAVEVGADGELKEIKVRRDDD